MVIQRIPMTPKGLKDVKEELEQLIKVERKSIVSAISEAREHGDLKENAEYHAAKEKQGMVEAKIRMLEQKVSAVQVIDVSIMSPEVYKVIFGSTVTISDDDTGNESCYKIVGEDEADFNKNMISVSSPLSRGLIGRQEGDEVRVRMPNGKELVYSILKVEYI
jgi:transcription elongation factor GreA